MTGSGVGGGAFRAPSSGRRRERHFPLPPVSPLGGPRGAGLGGGTGRRHPGSERAGDRAPGAGFRVCFYLAMGGAARTQRFSLRRAVRAQGAPRGAGRAAETQRRGDLEMGVPRQGETQRDREEETTGRRHRICRDSGPSDAGVLTRTPRRSPAGLKGRLSAHSPKVPRRAQPSGKARPGRPWAALPRGGGALPAWGELG